MSPESSGRGHGRPLPPYNASVIFTAGTHVGPYEILSHLGAGGQGEVYKARDTRLNRFVAIKALPDSLRQHPELRARFEREAQTLASLSHPHICPVFDVGQQDGIDYLVMEYIEGETLADRLKKSSPPLDQALRIAIEIADALDKAHRQGIAHRDIKPSNIMLTKGGAKLVDFGLAKTGLETNILGSVSQLPTDAGLTIQGSLLGTLQYMSPEQVEGQEADARSDIFCFGATLYEMITGAKAFEGKSQVSLMAAILEHEPRPISALVPVSPPLLEKIIRKCLAKDPNTRWQSISDVMEALEWVRGGAGEVTRSAAVPERKWWQGTTAVIALAIVAIVAIAALLVVRRTDKGPVWVSLIPPDTNFTPEPELAVSPDGKRIIFGAPDALGVNSLWLRSIDAADARELPGTAGGILPFWSPDGQSIGFFDFSNGKLARLDLSGGAPQVLAPAGNPRGGTWGSDGTILYIPAPASGIMKIPASGGTPSQIKVADVGLSSFEAPEFFPDGKHFSYFVFADPQRQGLYVSSLDGGETKRISSNLSKAEYANGHLFYCKGPDLFAQPFDTSKLEFTGEARRIAANIGTNYGDISNRAFSITSGGTLAFSAQSVLPTSQATWFDRSGKQLERIGEPGGYFGIALSPDRKKITLEKLDSQSSEVDIWLVEFTNGIASKLTAANTNPAWAADSEHVLYLAEDNSIQSIDINSGKKDTIFPVSEATLGAYMQSASPDGRFLVWTKSSGGQSDPWIGSLDGSHKAEPFLKTPYNEFRAEISPDGHWLAYVTNESGNDEVMVESFPNPGQRRRVSPEGGAFPEWRQDGKELYYLAPSTGQKRKLMAVKVETGSSFSASRPEFLFEMPPLLANPRRGEYVPVDNGSRFLVNAIVQESKPRAITLVLNWPSLLK